MATRARKPLFERLKVALEEGIAHAKGELPLRTIEVPDTSSEIDGTTLAVLQEQAALSQKAVGTNSAENSDK
jgi:hypothetical protein